MTSVTIQNATKTYGNLKAVDDVSISIPDGKFVCLLGPSGCGKTTLLRLIAGLEELSAGRLVIGDTDYSAVPAHKREFGMVFQSLALFPHLSVADNIAYPLKIRGANRQTCRQRATELLELVKLPGVEDRPIHQLSGGQRQRVAIARGLAVDPKVFLLDEPLSALDAKLREHMQVELRLLQKKLGVTTIVVTHDQREALSMADLVIIMENGIVHQIGPPMEIYRNPANSFVADFIGISNLLPCKLVTKARLDVLGAAVPLASQDTVSIATGESGVLSIRPEDVVLEKRRKNSGLVGTVSFIRDLGASVEITATVGDSNILSVCTPKRRPNVEIGDEVSIQFHMGRATVMAS